MQSYSLRGKKENKNNLVFALILDQRNCTDCRQRRIPSRWTVLLHFGCRHLGLSVLGQMDFMEAKFQRKKKLGRERASGNSLMHKY